MPVPRPPAEQVDAQPVVLAGTVAFGVASAVLAVLAGRLADDGHLGWLWTAVAGTVLGLVGLLVMRRHRREGRAPAARRPQRSSSSSPSS